MPDILQILGLTLIAGGCIPLGGWLASLENIRPAWLEEEFRHFVIALGGGVLLGAVSEVLIPEGIENLGRSSLWAIPMICLGGICLFGLEHLLGGRHRRSAMSEKAANLNNPIAKRISGSSSPQMIGMLLDYVPEAIALGGLVALQSPKALLLALLMGLQNLPEGFNTYRELVTDNSKSRQTLFFMVRLMLLGPLAGLCGFFFLSGQPQILGGMMLWSSGGILYLIFQDIAPQSRLEKHWAPPLGAVFGYCVAMFSEMIMHPSP